jgi:hypothetical protein
MRRDAETKKHLLSEWWGRFPPSLTHRILRAGDALDVERSVASLPPGPEVGESSVYVLFGEDGEGRVPLYVGKSDAPRSRWETHLKSFAQGEGVYRKWRQALLDGAGTARFDLWLLIVPASRITAPPIPGFPVTVGSVEYQLVALAADAFPGRLLNSEGRGRC